MRRTTVSPLLSTRSLAMLGAMLLALIVLGLGSSANKADAATQAVTKSFNKTAPILIPAGAHVVDCGSGPTQGAAASYPSAKTIKAFPAGSTIRDVNLVLRNFSHSFPDDVDVLLSKGQRNRTVMSDVGAGDDVNNITLTLDDEASTPLPDQQPPLASGTFKPFNSEGIDEFPGIAAADVSTNSSLSGFDGRNPNGIWALRVVDDTDDDCGQIGGGWTLIIKASVPTS